MTDTTQKKGWQEILGDGRKGIVIPSDWMHFNVDSEEDGEKLYELMEQHGYFKSKQEKEK